ncbi:16491_t:CDS:2 [Dentiscutata heterogama]|uniref:16491_t:CDS:1 n=1 Tax=Dentiscutata heterogama TaxID=1316150 RepID=A0ACA9KB46_9GLOM|nr:16491_t:CDS:2 [Dentiscutata heterogama]
MPFVYFKGYLFDAIGICKIYPSDFIGYKLITNKTFFNQFP